MGFNRTRLDRLRSIIGTSGCGAGYHSVPPKSVLTLNDVRIGKAYKATAQEVQVEGIPKGATVTPLVVDFTVRTYYINETQAAK